MFQNNAIYSTYSLVLSTSSLKFSKVTRVLVALISAAHDKSDHVLV